MNVTEKKNMIGLKKKEPEAFAGDLLIYFIQETGGNAIPCPGKAVRRNIKFAWKNGDFAGKQGQAFPSLLETFPPPDKTW